MLVEILQVLQFYISSMDNTIIFVSSLVFICITRLALAGVYRQWLAVCLPKPILSRIINPKLLSDEKKRKLHENVFYAIWHTLSFALVLRVCYHEPWFQQMLVSWETGWTIYGWPHSYSDQETSLYMFELAFWTSCLLFVAVETIRKDFKEMVIHHLSTVGLISLSFVYGFVRIGFVVLLVHDVGDIFLYSAKSCNYMKLEFITNIVFGIFVVVFFVSRLVIFTFVVRSAWMGTLNYYEEMNAVADPRARILPILLTVLQLLHYMWFVLILKMIYRMLFQATKTQKDIRSDDEDSDAENAPAKTNRTKKIE